MAISLYFMAADAVPTESPDCPSAIGWKRGPLLRFGKRWRAGPKRSNASRHDHRRPDGPDAEKPVASRQGSEKELSTRSHQPSFLKLRSRAGMSQTGRGKVRPDLRRAVRNDGSRLEPVAFGHGCEFIRLHLRGKSRQRDDRSSEDHENRE
jgi:hypothetical protein